MKKWWTKKRLTGVALSVAGLLVLIGIGYILWYSFPPPAEAKPLAQAQGMMSVRYTDQKSAIVLKPALPAAKGIVVYPGARVDPAAYAYNMSGLAQSGVAVVIVKPFLNIPFFDLRSRNDFAALVPEVKDWYVAGHSAGGVKACQVSQNAQYKGLILLASYCNDNISGSSVATLSIAGSADSITSSGDIETHKSKLPSLTQFKVIDGLNHAGFGDYGRQEGDGEATINETDTRQKITKLIADFLGVTPTPN